MKINSVININYNNFRSTIKQSNTQTKNPVESYNCSPLPLTRQYLAFMGGYSLNLAETLANLKDEAYPPDIKEMIEHEMDCGNPDNKTLIDVHREKYGKINAMKSLDEVREAFPEFRNVLSDNEVEYFNNSFIDKVKQGRLEWFDPDADLSLELLKMYWADGFSLSDLKEYTDGINISGVLEKFGIPRLDRTYANVLKLSDKQYNERFSASMSEKQKGIQRKRAEKRDGVYIPRGPMSEEAKKHISESLIKHYAEHPEKLAKISERMKKYYENHPEEKEKFELVMDIAWNSRDAKPIRKKMCKFFGKKDISANELRKLEQASNSSENKKTLKDFWDRNFWARKQWSNCMEQAWEKVKAGEVGPVGAVDSNIVSADFVVEIYPPSLKKDMKKWLRKNGYDLSKIPSEAYAAFVNKPGKDAPELHNEYAFNAVSRYFESDDRENLRADTLHIAMLKALGDIKKKFPNDADAIMFIATLRSLIMNEDGTVRPLTTEEALRIYTNAVALSKMEDDGKFAQILQDALEPAYCAVVTKNENALIRYLQNLH